ncbi:MAG TPA: nuclear transport factor 2 family protein [Sphingomonas sp.]|nr:nuclear transport factor 2 family protein [Sphingomonas sp.]
MLGLLLGLAATTQCPHDPATTAGLRAAEADWVAAIETHDVARLGCRLAVEFTDADWRGRRVPRAAVLARLPTRDHGRLALSDLEVAIHGAVGTVRGVNTQTAADGTLAGRVRFTDLFVHRDGRWQAIAAQETVIAPDRPES